MQSLVVELVFPSAWLSMVVTLGGMFGELLLEWVLAYLSVVEW
jgi:hypothetical protein